MRAQVGELAEGRPGPSPASWVPGESASRVRSSAHQATAAEALDDCPGRLMGPTSAFLLHGAESHTRGPAVVEPSVRERSSCLCVTLGVAQSPAPGGPCHTGRDPWNGVTPAPAQPLSAARHRACADPLSRRLCPAPRPLGWT